jgi:hypothetical protein
MLRKKLTQFNGYLKSYGLCFKNIEITNIEAVERFDLRIEKNMTTNSVGICQAARDIAMISEASYNKFRSTIRPFSKLPSMLKCRTHRKIIDQHWPVKEFVSPMNSADWNGAFIEDPILKIKSVCKNFLKQNQPQQDTFKILLCGDSLIISKTRISLLNFCFSLLNDQNSTYKYILGNIQNAFFCTYNNIWLNMFFNYISKRYIQNSKRILSNYKSFIEKNC